MAAIEMVLKLQHLPRWHQQFLSFNARKHRQDEVCLADASHKVHNPP